MALILAHGNVERRVGNRPHQCDSLLLPSNAISGVFQRDSEGGEAVSDSVRGGEVLSLSRFLSQPHDEVHHALEAVGCKRGGLEKSEDIANGSKGCGRGVEFGSAGTYLDRLV